MTNETLCEVFSVSFPVFYELFLVMYFSSVISSFVIVLLHSLLKIVLFIYLLAAACSVWDLSSLTRDQICAPCIGRWSLNH